MFGYGSSRANFNTRFAQIVQGIDAISDKALTLKTLLTLYFNGVGAPSAASLDLVRSNPRFSGLTSEQCQLPGFRAKAFYAAATASERVLPGAGLTV